MSINEEQLVVICTPPSSVEVGDNEASACEIVPLWATPLRASNRVEQGDNRMAAAIVSKVESYANA